VFHSSLGHVYFLRIKNYNPIQNAITNIILQNYFSPFYLELFLQTKCDFYKLFSLSYCIKRNKVHR